MLYPGFEGVAAFTTSICRPMSEGNELRYRGIDVRELAGKWSYDEVWRLLVTGEPGSGVLSDVPIGLVAGMLSGSGRTRVMLQRMLLQLGEDRGMRASTEVGAYQFQQDLGELTTAFAYGLGALMSGDPETASADAGEPPESIAQGLVRAWKGGEDPEAQRVIDLVMSTIAEHGTTASTFASRVVASTGVDAAACVAAGLSALSGPRHGGATGNVARLLRSLSANGVEVIRPYVASLLDAGDRLPGLGHRIYRGGDPRVPLLREVAAGLGAPLASIAEEYEQSAQAEFAARGKERRLPANADLWIPVVLDAIRVPDAHMDSVLAAGRIGGWSAHCVEQVRSGGKLLRPSDIYAEPAGSETR